MHELSQKSQTLLEKLGMTTEEAMSILLRCIVYSDPALRKELENVQGMELGYITFGDSLNKLHIDDLAANKPLTQAQIKELALGMYLMGLFDSTGFGLSPVEDPTKKSKNSLTELID